MLHKIDTQPDITKRISEAEALKINERLEQLPEISETIQALISANNQGQKELWMTEPAIHDPSMPLYALLAYQEGFLEKSSFTTLMLYWAAVQYHGRERVEVHFLFEEEMSNSQTILQQSIQVEGYNPLENFALTEDEFEYFLAELKTKPLSEHRFFLVPIPSKTILDEFEKISFSIFGIVDDKYMIPSFGMMQTFLEVKCKYSVEMDVMMGLESLKGIRDSILEKKRPFAIHFPYVFLPEDADGFAAPWYVFSIHDFYHAAIVSVIPPRHRGLFIALSDAVQEMSVLKFLSIMESLSFFPEKISTLVKEYGEEPEDQLQQFIIERIIDMEHSNYRFEGTFGLGFVDEFWLSFLVVIISAKLKLLGIKPEMATFALDRFASISSLNLDPIIFKMFEVINRLFPELTSVPASDFNRLKSLLQQGNNSFGFLPIILILMDNELEKLKISWRKANFFNMLDKFLSLQLNATSQTEYIRQQITPYFSPDNVFPAFELSRKQSNDNLLQACTTYMIEHYFSTDNVLPIFYRACDDGVRALQQASMIYMSKHLVALMDESSFAEFKKNQPQRFKKFIQQALSSRFYKLIINDILKLSLAKLDQGIQILVLAKPLNYLYPDGYTLLDYAVASKNVEAVRILLNKGANPNPQAGSKAIPSLFSAIYHASGQIFRLLRRHGFDMNLRYEGKNWQKYFVTQCSDPNNTYAGITGEFVATMKVGGSYSFSDDNKFRLFCAAKDASSKIKDHQSLLSPESMSVEEYTFSLMENEMDWACNRLSVLNA